MSKIEALNSQNKATIILDGDSGNISAGGSGVAGTLVTKSTTGAEIVKLGVSVSVPEPMYPGGPIAPQQVGGSLELKDLQGKGRLFFNGANSDIYLGGNGADGDLFVTNSAGKSTIHLDGNSGNISAGGIDVTGTLVTKSTTGTELVKLGVSVSVPEPMYPGGPIAPQQVGGSLELKDLQGKGRLFFNGANSDIYLGGNGADGDLFVTNSAGKSTIHLDGNTGNMTLEGDIQGKGRLFFNGANSDIYLGGNGADGDLFVTNSAGKSTIHLDGNTGNMTLEGDISLVNADCAEDFDVVDPSGVDPGTVMVLGANGAVEPSREPYDRKVAGIVSGAGGYKPGLVLDRQPSDRIRRPLALMGKAYCKVDATHAPIEVGDLLTTSSTPGHAMRASDASRAFGAVLGKALAPLSCGQGLIPVLVALH